MALRPLRFTTSSRMRIVSLLTVIAFTGCSTIRYVPPEKLDLGHAPRSFEPGRWHVIKGYVDRRNITRSADGRVRTIPGDSLELELYSTSRTVSHTSSRSIMPRDSVSLLRVLEPNPRDAVLIIAGVVAVVVVFAVSFANGLKRVYVSGTTP